MSEQSTGNPLDDFLDDSVESTENPFNQADGRNFDPFESITPPAMPTPPTDPVPLTVPRQSPLHEPAPATKPQTQQVSFISEPPEKTQKSETEQIESTGDPFAAALEKAQAKSDQILSDSFAGSLPKFSYAKVKEDITDAEKTFDDLREQYEADFPELSEKKRVSWTVTYGKVTKPIIKPEADKVYEIKAEIEKSKVFLDGIKKAKTDAERQPECLVTPKVTAQSKGEIMASYKGIYPTLEAAVTENKPIMYVPGRDGKVYEIRNNDIGRFITPAASPPELSQITPGLTLSLPKIPYSLLCRIISFFRALSDENHLEALANIYFDKQYQEYRVHIPQQILSKYSADTENTYSEDVEGLLHVMDIHSHNIMPAKFSPIDDRDEKATRIYAVVGKLDEYFPEITVRISNGGKFMKIHPGDVFELYEKEFPYPYEWEESIISLKEPDGEHQ